MSIKFDKKQNIDVLNDLKQLGLSEKEAVVYCSLLHQGEVGSSKIITSTGLHGQFVYQALHNLEEKGLVQHIIMRGRKKFSAKSPRTLLNLIDQQKRVAESVRDRLESMVVAPEQRQFEIFQGQETFVSHEFDVLRSAPEGSSLLIIGGAGDGFINALGKQFGEYEYIRIKKNIKVRYIGSEGQRTHLMNASETRTLFEYRLLPGLFTGEVNTNIWTDVIGFNIFGEPTTNFTISNRKIAESYRKFFETLWKIAR